MFICSEWELVQHKAASKGKEVIAPVCEWQKRPQPFRARMCEHMVNGKCARPGGNCYYAHTEPELTKWKALFAPTKQCSGGSACAQAAKNNSGVCPHSHTPAEQQEAIKKYLRARSECLRRMHS